MPLIQISCSQIAPEKKKVLIEKVTAAASEAMGVPETSYSVYINEVGADNVGVGGKQLSEIRKNK